MVISDIGYQENVSESATLTGGIDIGASLTTWDSSLTQLATMSMSGPGGSTTVSGATTLDISSLGFSFVALGL